MGLRRLTTIATASVLSLVMLVGQPATASAWWDRHQARDVHDAQVGYAVPIQSVYQFPAAIVYQPTQPYGYAVPIQSVYQFPAAIVYQPGVLGPPAAPASIAGPIPGHRLFP
jgi:hypothetical protein